MWREANPYIVDFWRRCKADAKTAILNKGSFGAFDLQGGWLRIKLPSGRYLCYSNAKIADGVIKYAGVNPYTRKWESVPTYGGKLAENIVQAVSRDILAHGMKLAEKEGYRVVLSVHDELVTEVPDSPEFTHERLSEIMSAAPAWAEGLPLAAAGFESKRYRKG
jgi:DNA polymerase